MQATLLKTKLFIPSTRPELVSRQKLVRRLNAGLHRKLTLISAPAGFGKTTLVSEWVDNLRLNIKKENNTDTLVGWLSLDEGDNDPVRFLTYFISCLNQIERIEPSLGEGALIMLQSPQPPPTDSILTSLINDLTVIKHKIILVLDDYHLIESQTIHDALSFLIEHLPPQLHLGIATREDPQISLASLRAKDQLTELRGVDLKFTSSEVNEFLNQIMGLNLSDEDVELLEARTEGWIAGLHLAAISMQNQEDTTTFIQSFTGSHRLVMDYLFEEILNQQSDDMRTFLLQTSMLNQLTGSLCDAITDQDNSQTILENLVRSNLFIVPLDEERCWYRYHHLFADLLRQRLRQTQPDQVSTLHRKAGKWYEDQNLVTEALYHIFAIKDYEWAGRLVEKIGAETFWKLGDWISLLHWLSKIPKDVVLSRPELCLLSAWSMAQSNNPEPIEPFLMSVESYLLADGVNRKNREACLEDTIEASSDTSIMSKDAGSMTAEVATIRAVSAYRRGDLNRAYELYQLAIEIMPEDNLFLRARIIGGLAEIHFLRGEVVAAGRLYAEAHNSSLESGYIHWASSVVWSRLADVLLMQGQLHQAADIYQQMQHVFTSQGEQNYLTAGYACIGMGQIMYAWNDLDGAVQQLQEGINLGKRVASPRILILGYLALTRALQAQGDAPGAINTIQEASKVWQHYHLTRWDLLPPVATYQAWLSLVQGDIPSAVQWAEEQGLRADDELSYQYELDYITLARLLIAQGKAVEASKLLQRLIPSAEEEGRTSRVIEILILQAIANQVINHNDEAMIALKQALKLAEPEGFIRVFVDEGPPMASLLYATLEQGIATTYVQRLLAAFPVTDAEQAFSKKTQVDQSELIEPLSEREIEVLQLIAEGLTNQEIAIRLYISLNTVKVHTRNINGKLGVHTRTQAVAEARVLGILS